MLELCLNEFSWRGTLLLLGGICFHIIAAGALFRSPPLQYVDEDDFSDATGTEDDNLKPTQNQITTRLK